MAILSYLIDIVRVLHSNLSVPMDTPYTAGARRSVVRRLLSGFQCPMSDDEASQGQARQARPRAPVSLEYHQQDQLTRPALSLVPPNLPCRLAPAVLDWSRSKI